MSTVDTTSPDPAAAPEREPGSARATLARVSRDLPLVPIAVLVGMFIYGAVTIQDFSSWASIRTMLLIASFLGIAALGQTLLVMMGNVDLSVPGFIGFGNIMIAVLYGQHNWPFIAALALIIVASALIGTINGLICHKLKVESIVVTLGMSFVIIGVISVITATGVTGAGPAWLTRFATAGSHTLGVAIPPVVVVWAIIALIAAFMLRRTIAGRRVYLTGSNPLAAELALVKTGRIITAAFALSAVSGAVTGVLLIGFSGTGNSQIGNSYLFTSLTAVIVGGTSIMGGRGDYTRTVIGAIMLTVINTVLLAKGYSDAEQQILFGVIILIAILAYGREPRLRDQI
jgi:ribose transport system permease protein